MHTLLSVTQPTTRVPVDKIGTLLHFVELT